MFVALPPSTEHSSMNKIATQLKPNITSQWMEIQL